MRVWGDRYGRELQRYTLAWRMLGLQARTQTVASWAGLPKARVRTLNRSHGTEQHTRSDNLRRGPSPTSVVHFLRSPRLRTEAAALAGIFHALNLLPERPLRNAVRDLPGVERGERLCDAFEMYLSLVPDSAVSFEQGIMLLTASAPGGDLLLDRCTACGCGIAVDRYGDPRRICSGCCEAGVRLAALGLSPASDRSSAGSASPALA
jgi:hypothetical protein